MRILIIGGTAFVGRATAHLAHAAGHDVTVINRGRTESDLPEGVERLLGDRQSDLSALERRSFDATVDVIAYRPFEVDVLADALGDRGGHHVQVSSISAYEDPPVAGADESTPLQKDPDDLLAPVTGERYGALKAACERRAAERFGDISVVRPTYVVGAHDMTMRFPYWVARLRRGGDVAVPGPSSAPFQWINAMDLGAFIVRLAEIGQRGAFNALGPDPAPSFAETLDTVARVVAPAGTRLLEVPASMVIEHGLEGSFPLWSGPSPEWVMAMSNDASLAAGLQLRPLEETAIEVADWLGDTWADHWLSPATERDLLSS